jgi:hypothetical protein
MSGYNTPIISPASGVTPPPSDCCCAKHLCCGSSHALGLTFDRLCVYPSGNGAVSLCDSSNLAKSRCVGVWRDNNGDCGTCTCCNNGFRCGGEQEVQFLGAAPNVGDELFLAGVGDGSSPTGKVMTTPPTVSGRIIAPVGICTDASTASLGYVKMVLQIQSPIEVI